MTNIKDLCLELFYSIVDSLLDFLTPQKIIKSFFWLISWILISYFLSFGTIYFLSSIIYLIFTNLGKRKKGSLSAYSMFNENNERITGTFDGEIYDKMLRNGGNINLSKYKNSNNLNLNYSNRKKLSKKGKLLNKPCFCGSKKKYKKCCLKKEAKKRKQEAREIDEFYNENLSD